MRASDRIWLPLAIAVPVLGMATIVATRLSDQPLALEAAAPAAAARAARQTKRSAPSVNPRPAVVTQSSVASDPKGPDFVVRRVLDIPGRIAFGTWYWDEAGVPDGPIVITVDLAAQTISVFRDGYEIGTAAIIYGDDGLPTPLGIFPILEKDADHISNLYNAPMPYMLRLTNDGISIHGSLVRRNYATHGCVGIPTPFAKKLFGVARVGDHVIITRNKRLPGTPA